jgi:hypothetical protein
MMLAMLALSLLILRGLDPVLNKRTMIQVISLGLFWFSFLFVMNRRPQLTFPLLVIVLVQAGVAIAQFGLQQDLGLAYLGEPDLDLQVIGTSVLWSSEEVWLRAYGLTPHPNMLGAMLAVQLLVLLPQLYQRRGWQQTLLGVGLAVGLLGLLVSFSRAGWLAFLGGLIYWAFAGADVAPQTAAERTPFWTQSARWLPFLIVPVFVIFYYDLILSRWIHLDTEIEARSIHERVRDAHVALVLIGAHPWQGIGAGNGLVAAQTVLPGAGTVHNISLLVMMEVGIVGGVCWLLFMLAPLLSLANGRRGAAWHDFGAIGPSRRLSNHGPMYRPVWIGLLIAGLFDTSLWLTMGWRAALLLGILAALQLQTVDGRKESA